MNATDSDGSFSASMSNGLVWGTVYMRSKTKLRFSQRAWIKEFDKTEAPFVVTTTPVYVSKVSFNDAGETPKKKLRKSPALKRRSPSPKRRPK